MTETRKKQHGVLREEAKLRASQYTNVQNLFGILIKPSSFRSYSGHLQRSSQGNWCHRVTKTQWRSWTHRPILWQDAELCGERYDIGSTELHPIFSLAPHEGGVAAGARETAGWLWIANQLDDAAHWPPQSDPGRAGARNVRKTECVGFS